MRILHTFNKSIDYLFYLTRLLVLRRSLCKHKCLQSVAGAEARCRARPAERVLITRFRFYELDVFR